MIGENNQEEEDGCEDRTAPSVPRAAVRIKAEQRQGQDGKGEELIYSASTLCSGKQFHLCLGWIFASPHRVAEQG